MYILRCKSPSNNQHPMPRKCHPNLPFFRRKGNQACIFSLEYSFPETIDVWEASHFGIVKLTVLRASLCLLPVQEVCYRPSFQQAHMLFDAATVKSGITRLMQQTCSDGPRHTLANNFPAAPCLAAAKVSKTWQHIDTMLDWP